MSSRLSAVIASDGVDAASGRALDVLVVAQIGSDIDQSAEVGERGAVSPDRVGAVGSEFGLGQIRCVRSAGVVGGSVHGVVPD